MSTNLSKGPLWTALDVGTRVMVVPSGMVIQTYTYTDGETVTVAEALVFVPCTEREAELWIEEHKA